MKSLGAHTSRMAMHGEECTVIHIGIGSRPWLASFTARDATHAAPTQRYLVSKSRYGVCIIIGRWGRSHNLKLVRLQ